MKSPHHFGPTPPPSRQRDYAKLSYIFANIALGIAVLSAALPFSYLITVRAINETKATSHQVHY